MEEMPRGCLSSFLRDCGTHARYCTFEGPQNAAETIYTGRRNSPSRINPLFMLRSTFLVLSVILDVSTGSWNCDLYSEGDNLVCAKKGTLTETIRRNQWTWLVEFYSSWCGHCQYFAPTWKKFAHSLESQSG